MGKKRLSACLSLALVIVMLTVSFVDQNPLYDFLMTTRLADLVYNPLYVGETTKEEAVNTAEAETVTEVNAENDDNALILWYTDDALTEYVTTTALSYQADYGVKVIPVLVSGVEYLEQINHASVYEGEKSENGEQVGPSPDLYITTHDNLMKQRGFYSELYNNYR